MFYDGEGCIIVRNAVDVTIGPIETDDERVVEWVTDVFDTHRDAATLLAPADLSAFRGEVAAQS